jgi:hypothetical protein
MSGHLLTLLAIKKEVMDLSRWVARVAKWPGSILEARNASGPWCLNRCYRCQIGNEPLSSCMMIVKMAVE